MSLLHPFLHKFASYMWYIYICPKRTYSCIKRMRGQQVFLRERIPNKMFVTLSTYFYAGTRMLNYSCMDVVYTSKKKIKLKIGMIQLLQTYGADMKWNPHVHCIVTEDGFDRQWNWIHTYYIPYEYWRKKWQYMLLTMLKKEMPTCRENSDFITASACNF